MRPKHPLGHPYTCPHQRSPLPLHRRLPGGEWAQKLRDLLTVCVKVLPDFQELGRRQLGQVQVRGLLLRASHGEPLGDLRRTALSLRPAPLPHSARSCAPRCLYIQSGGCARAWPPAGGARAQRISPGRGRAAAAQGLGQWARGGGSAGGAHADAETARRQAREAGAIWHTERGDAALVSL